MSQMNFENLFFYDTDDEAEVNSLVCGFLRDGALVIQAYTPTIRKYQRNHIVRDRYGAHDQGRDAVGKAGISALVKCTSAIRQLAYDAVPDSLDEYLQIDDKTSRDCLMAFCNGVMELYGEEFLRRPTQTDVEKVYAFHEEKHRYPGMIDIIDCTKWPWAQCPQAYRAQFSRVGKAPEVSFVANGVNYKWGYYLTDEIYPEWVVLMKCISQPGSNDVKQIRYKQAHEAARKDVERAFSMLKKKWVIKKKAISPDYYPKEQHREDDPVRSAQDRLRVIREIHDEETHLSLKADLVEHIWHRTNAH
ncbi:protein translocase subunit SecA2, chloroplastic isoform X1 [Tanacetum coccineum]